MKIQGLLAAVSIVALAGCSQEVEEPRDPWVHRVVSNAQTGAQFDVEVRYVGGLTEADARALASRIEIAPTRELFPGVDLSTEPAATPDEPLDASEPTFEVVLHPLNDAAARERHSWRLPAEKPAKTTTNGELATVSQAVSADVAVNVRLDPGETWRTARQRCYAPFTFVADVAGFSKVCIDLGYDGVAGSICVNALDPREPVVLAHPGPDIIPWNKHYFRGRVKATTLFGIGSGAYVIAAGYLCL